MLRYRTTSDRACALIVERIMAGIQAQTDVAVIGLSGGADSTLTAILCAQALGKDRVYGLSMPYGETDHMSFNALSARVAEHLGIHHGAASIAAPVEATTELRALLAQFGAPAFSQLQNGNLRSRMRMVYLYATAGSLAELHAGLRVRVVGTGNLSEDFIGYDTKYGDAGCDFFPIGELYKREIYDLLEYFKRNPPIWLPDELINRTPSAGLWEGQTDASELGYAYDEMAPAIDWLKWRKSKRPDEAEVLADIAYLAQTDPDFARVCTFVWQRHLNNRHKHMAAEPTSLDSIDWPLSEPQADHPYTARLEREPGRHYVNP